MAVNLVGDMQRRNGFTVRNFNAFLSLKYSQAETTRASIRRESIEAGPVAESVQDPRERADRCADTSEAGTFIEEILELPAGQYLVYYLAVARSLRQALREGEAAGVKRAWMRDKAPEIVGVWRTLHGAKRNKQAPDGRRGRIKPIRSIQDALAFARGQDRRKHRNLDEVLYSTGRRGKQKGDE